MKKSLFLICAGVLLWSLAGCNESSYTSERTKCSNTSLTSTEGLIRYLQNIPNVKQVDVWDNPYGEGLRIKTAHYNVYTTFCDPLMLKRVPAFVESAFLTYQKQFGGTSSIDVTFDTYLFAERTQWEAYTKTFAGAAEAVQLLKIQKGAYVKDGVCVAYNIGRESTFSVLGHEGWHQFNQKLFTYRLPSWLDEGIATLFETCRYEQGRFVFDPADNLNRRGNLRLAIVEGDLIPLRDLITLNPGQVMITQDDSQSAVMAFYAQNYALVRFLREHDYGRYYLKYRKLLFDGVEGQWPIDSVCCHIAADRSVPLTIGWNRKVSMDLFRLYIDEDIERIEREYLGYCAKIAYQVKVKRTRVISSLMN